MRFASFRTLLKYSNGLCFCAYNLRATCTVPPSPESTVSIGAYSSVEPTPGIVCMYAFHVIDLASSWSTIVSPPNQWGVADACVACASVSPCVAVESPEPGTNSSGSHFTVSPAAQSSQMPWKSPLIAAR